MHPLKRAYQTAHDYWRIRPFLREVFLLNGRREISWPVARWDYWRWPGAESFGDGPLEGRVFTWEEPEGRIVAMLNPESRGHAFLQLHPEWRSAELEREMVETAEQVLAVDSEGGRTLRVWVDSRDASLQDLLQGLGYSRTQVAESQHRRDLTRPTPDIVPPEGFTVRSLGDASELPARAWCSWKAFHPDAPDKDYGGWEWYLNIQRCPLYRRDLDLVTIAPNGDLASFTTVWYDDVTRSAYFEPVGTHVDYWRRGLGKAVIAEGLRRLVPLGATLAFVGGYSPEANGLYSTLFGPEHDCSEEWKKSWSG